ncbi:MAG: right-handed parallel beta-helix repeat-containing protein [Lachnospiraceae bacterium]|nr:right-handed parallel beta-helix repeat-containing protein [Lachnospiraceae bacterium]
MVNHKIKQRLLIGLLTATMSLQFAGCGTVQNNGSGQDAGADKENAQANETMEQPAASAESAGSGGDSSSIKTDSLVGDWVMVYTIYHSEYEDEEPYEYVTMKDDEYAPEAEMKIRKDGDKLLADYKYTYEMGGCDRFYGNELVYRAEQAYDGCENDQWSYAFSMPFADDEEKIITLTDPDTLVQYEYYENDPEEMGEDYYEYKCHTKYVYLRADSPKLENMEDLRYFKTVTVSDAKQLLNSIDNNTKIVLEAGTYNLSDVREEDISNPYLVWEYGEMSVTASNVCFEAKDGAEVLICVNDPYVPVLSFDYSTNVTLRGVTVGHNVEKGHCTGSVLNYLGVSGATIEDCKLYGCGTYGIEAENCSLMNVRGTEIYECTYGLVSLANVTNALFQNCDMRDSSELSMFSMWSSYDIVFDNCKIHDNVTSTNYETSFIHLEDEYSDVTFQNCEFTNNTYKQLTNGTVSFEKCTISDNVR